MQKGMPFCQELSALTGSACPAPQAKAFPSTFSLRSWPSRPGGGGGNPIQSTGPHGLEGARVGAALPLELVGEDRMEVGGCALPGARCSGVYSLTMSSVTHRHSGSLFLKSNSNDLAEQWPVFIQEVKTQSTSLCIPYSSSRFVSH